MYDGDFSFTVSGLLFSVCYALILFLFIQFQAGRAMKRTNVIEVINEQRRQEPMKKSVSKAYLISGIVLTLAGSSARSSFLRSSLIRQGSSSAHGQMHFTLRQSSAYTVCLYIPFPATSGDGIRRNITTI